MKQFVFTRIDFFVRRNFFWAFITPFLRLSEAFKYRRSVYNHQQAEKELKAHFSDLTVRTGFFTGLKYPDFKSYGSSLFPKLLGSYESELHSVFASLAHKKYTAIIDIGCAEGYYAVGLAKRFKGATVYAYDTDVLSLQQCRTMAQLNGVDDVVQLGAKCSAETLRDFPFTGKALLVCDCEGFEKELFNSSNLANLSACDLIIETHLFHNADINRYLIDLFSSTHEITVVSSHDDDRKVFTYKNYIANLSPLAQRKAIIEGRPFTMDWLVLQAKKALA